MTRTRMGTGAREGKSPRKGEEEDENEEDDMPVDDVRIEMKDDGDEDEEESALLSPADTVQHPGASPCDPLDPSTLLNLSPLFAPEPPNTSSVTQPECCSGLPVFRKHHCMPGMCSRLRALSPDAQVRVTTEGEESASTANSKRDSPHQVFDSWRMVMLHSTS